MKKNFMAWHRRIRKGVRLWRRTKDEQRGTWYVSFHYYDWTGKNCRKVKRGFKTKREATDVGTAFRMKEAADLDMTFEEFVQAYTKRYEAETETQYLADERAYLEDKATALFKHKKMRDIRPKRYYPVAE